MPPPIPDRPVQYGSLSDLTKGKGKTAQTYAYQPQPERQGYQPEPSYPAAPPRRVPPIHKDGMMHDPLPPPRHASPAARPVPPPPAVPAGKSSFASTAASYVPNSASATFMSMSDRVREGAGSIATQERKDQVVGGLAKVGVGAAKLMGKGAYQIGKFAASSK